jgi:hypothetical protein
MAWLENTLALSVFGNLGWTEILSFFPPTNSECFKANPMLNQTIFYKMILDKPSATESEICGGMWKRSGTCCNQTLAIGVARLRNRIIDQTVQDFTSAVKDLKINISRNTKGIEGSGILNRPESEFLKNIVCDVKFGHFNKSAHRCGDHLK